jgi:hypothetical protein
MPYSLKSGKSETLKWFADNESTINKIVDIGPGSGTYIKLVKEENNYCKTAHWIGIEVWNPYIEKYKLAERYNQVINKDVRLVDWLEIGPISVVIAGDVLEHISKEDAMVLVDKILSVSKMLIISIPIVHMPQEHNAYDNPYEEHVKDDWSHDEVMSTWPQYIKQHYRKGKKSKLGVYWMSK